VTAGRCAVFGMPEEALRLAATDRVPALDELPQAIPEA